MTQVQFQRHQPHNRKYFIDRFVFLEKHRQKYAKNRRYDYVGKVCQGASLQGVIKIGLE